jgi:hypothetical protein
MSQKLPERNAEIIRLSKEGKTSTQIKDILGLKSRNVAIGVLARARIAGDTSIPTRAAYRDTVRSQEERTRRAMLAQVRSAEADAERQQARRAAEAELAERMRIQAEERAKRVEAMSKEREAASFAGLRWTPSSKLDPSQGVSILNVRHGQCRAVRDNKHEGLAVFCGDVTLTGKSFCGMHYKLFYTKSQPPVVRKTKPHTRLIRGYA